MPPAMSTILKTGPHRTVRLEVVDPPEQPDSPASIGPRAEADAAPPGAPGSGRARIVKRFERGGPLGWIRDRRNARREFALLRELHARGLPVPRPLGLERRGAGFEVAMERIEGETLLERCGDADPAGSAELAHRLGRLLARLQRAGLDHPDIHARNVLVRPDGELVAIDFHAARLRRPLRTAALPPTWRRDLVVGAAGLRDGTARTFRARALRAWLAELQPRMERGERHALARSIEAEARRFRRAFVLKRRRRWTRIGTACRAVVDARAEPVGLAARELSEADEARLRAALESGADELAGAWHWLLIRTDPRRARALQEIAGRLAEHELAAARPALWIQRPAAAVALALPRGARPLAAGDIDPIERARFEARLRDRGLGLVREAAFWRAPDGRLVAAGVDRLRSVDPDEEAR